VAYLTYILTNKHRLLWSTNIALEDLLRICITVKEVTETDAVTISGLVLAAYF